ncbi:MAG: CHAT domain-containing protein, partial [Akkermansiaceae bacterium]|nr:CHAT domain-containing protein [Akkermansiaceae bacterium]
GQYYVAQSRGLQGVALWRQGSIENKVQGLKLLQRSVDDLIHPKNSDYLDQQGIRPDVRQLIIGTYIEAVAELDPSRILQALGLADWLRAGMVQEALSDAAVRSAANTEGLSALVRQEQDAKNEIRGLRSYLQGEAGSAQSPLPEIASQMRNRINVLEKERTQLQASIKAGFPGYERLVRPQPASLDEISQKLTTDEALIVVMPDANGINIWAVKQENGRTKAKFHRVAITADQIKHTVEVLRQSLESISTQGKVTPFNDQLAYQTYQALLEPLGDILNDRKNWIVAASGVLARLPFAVLQTQQPNKLTKPAWLIQKVSLTQTPSVSAWLSLRTLLRRQVPSEALIAWGDPVFNPNFSKSQSITKVRNLNFTRTYSNDLDSELPNSNVIYHDIPELPDTREELNNIAKSLQADSANDLILGSKATRQSVLKANTDGLLAKKKVIVFATHGLMAGDLPKLMQPALALSADGSEIQNSLSPLLTLDDILNLKLNADWVVLSACNTASADGKAEEALSGLARGFFYAGSRSMLVTHWAVESESAKELTTRTFTHFTQNPTSPKAESLQSAILQVMSDPKFEHPAFWAPYVLVGDSQR